MDWKILSSSFISTIFITFAMLVTGSINTISKKLQYQTTSTGVYGSVQYFAKPYITTLCMFAGEALCLFLVFWKFIYSRTIRQKISQRSTNTISLESEEPLGEFEEIEDNEEIDGKKVKNKKRSSSVFLLLPPAILDVFGTTLGGLGLLFVSASVFQMLRGSIIVFTGVFSIIILRRRLKPHQYVGITIVVVGIFFIGIYSVVRGDSASADTTWLSSILGVLLCISGQACNALQFVLEEFFLKNRDIEPESIVGLEGMWGASVMLMIVLPAVYVIPGGDYGSVENSYNTIVMLSHNGFILSFFLAYFLSISFYNFFSLTMARHLSAIHRTLIDTCRTISVWGIELVLVIFPPYGEKITIYTPIQLFGFLLLIIGTLIHNDVIGVSTAKFIVKHIRNLYRIIVGGSHTDDQDEKEPIVKVLEIIGEE